MALAALGCGFLALLFLVGIPELSKPMSGWASSFAWMTMSLVLGIINLRACWRYVVGKSVRAPFKLYLVNSAIILLSLFVLSNMARA